MIELEYNAIAIITLYKGINIIDRKRRQLLRIIKLG
jgi:hypothetical protein